MRFAYASVGAEDPYADGEQLGREIVNQLKTAKPVFSLLFTTVTDKTRLQGLLNGLKSKLDTRTLIGCTSCGNIIDDRIIEGTVMLSLYSTRFSVGFAVGESISDNGFKAGKAATSSALAQLESFGMPTAKMKRFVMMFPDGLSGAEESVIEGIRSIVGMHTPIIGGSAGDNLKMTKAYQICNGRIYTDSVALVFIQTVYNFGFASHHGWKPTNKTAFVTKASGRLIEALNDEPALDTYAKMIEQSSAKLKKGAFNWEEYFRHPLAERDLGGDYWLKYLKAIKGDKLEVFSDVAEGTALTLMEVDEASLLGVVEQAVDEISRDVHFPGCFIIFSSVGRKKLLGSRITEELKKFKENFLGIPVIGFYTMGEQGYTKRSISGHQNHTLNILCIGSGRHERFDSAEIISMLTDFGLGGLESKMYATLLDASPCAVKRLHELTNINYAKLYDVIGHLQDKGLITLSPFRPKKIYAKELSEGLFYLFKTLDEEYREGRKKRLEILNDVSRGKYRDMVESEAPGQRKVELA